MLCFVKLRALYITLCDLNLYMLVLYFINLINILINEAV